MILRESYRRHIGIASKSVARSLSPLPSTRRLCALGITSVLMFGFQTEHPAMALQWGGMKAEIAVKSCVVESKNSAGKSYDCVREAQTACDGKDLCEIAIGDNLTGGKDIDPSAGFLDKTVTLTYICGGSTRQRGPFEQNNHATAVLDCFGPE